MNSFPLAFLCRKTFVLLRVLWSVVDPTARLRYCSKAVFRRSFGAHPPRSTAISDFPSHNSRLLLTVCTLPRWNLCASAPHKNKHITIPSCWKGGNHSQGDGNMPPGAAQRKNASCALEIQNSRVWFQKIQLRDSHILLASCKAVISVWSGSLAQCNMMKYYEVAFIWLLSFCHTCKNSTRREN